MLSTDIHYAAASIVDRLDVTAGLGHCFQQLHACSNPIDCIFDMVGD